MTNKLHTHKSVVEYIKKIENLKNEYIKLKNKSEKKCPDNKYFDYTCDIPFSAVTYDYII